MKINGSIVALALVAYSLSAPAETNSEPWWSFASSSWCIQSQSSSACLPKSFVLMRVEGADLEFVDRSSAPLTVFLDYSSRRGVAELEKTIIDDSFELLDRCVVNGLSISKFASKTDEVMSRDQFVYFIDFGSNHTIVLYGRQSSKVSIVLESLLDQWQ